MPNITDYPFNPEHEAKYRRGYVHGVANAISGMVHILSDDHRKTIELWLANRLYQRSFRLTDVGPIAHSD